MNVDEFFFYLAVERGSESAADRFLHAMENAYQRLGEHPAIGDWRLAIGDRRVAAAELWAARTGRLAHVAEAGLKKSVSDQAAS